MHVRRDDGGAMDVDWYLCNYAWCVSAWFAAEFEYDTRWGFPKKFPKFEGRWFLLENTKRPS